MQCPQAHRDQQLPFFPPLVVLASQPDFRITGYVVPGYAKATSTVIRIVKNIFMFISTTSSVHGTMLAKFTMLRIGERTLRDVGLALW